MERTSEKGLPISARFPRKARQLRALLWLAALLLGVGLSAPIITLKKFFLVSNTFSLTSGAFQLLKDGQWFLFLVVFSFSVVLPILKLGILLRLVAGNPGSDEITMKCLHWMHVYGK